MRALFSQLSEFFVSSLSFSSLNLHPLLVKNLSSLNYHEMTPIQAQSLPFILDGKDVIAQGKTGSGKTAAFGLGILHNLDVKNFRIQALVLCPTRELADQVAESLRQLSRTVHNIKILTLCGGVPIGPQIGSLEHGAHIIVGTPGRIEDHLSKVTLSLAQVNTLVLDEADRMLEMGFQSAIDHIIELTPNSRQTLLFSATFPEQIKPLTQRIMKNPEHVAITNSANNQNISQRFYQVDGHDDRSLAIRALLLDIEPESAIIFCATKIETQEVADELKAKGFSALALHGDLEQRERDQTLVQFANQSCSVLVATDVAARGLDIDSVDAVFNYHLSRDPEIHVHRIGRTGRADKKGIACSLVSEKDGRKLALIEDYLDKKITVEPLPASSVLTKKPVKPNLVTLQIDGGKKQKLRPGDILGALTSNQGIQGSQVGKIKIFALKSYVAVERSVANKALSQITGDKLKGRKFKARKLSIN
jgi:ATP-independent RNA helicase DbpA